MIYLKKFDTQTAYTAAQSSLILPNVSLVTENNTVHYNPLQPTPPSDLSLVCRYNITDTSEATNLFEYNDYPEFMENVVSMEIDGVEQQEVIGSYVFDEEGIHTVKYTLDDNTKIDNWAFDNCYSLISIDIPNSVTSIGEGAFANCSSLTSCTIGSGVTNIVYGAFQSCTSLTSIICNRATAPSIYSSTFQYVKRNGTLYVPIGSSGYDVWMGSSEYYLGYYNWTKVEQ